MSAKDRCFIDLFKRYEIIHSPRSDTINRKKGLDTNVEDLLVVWRDLYDLER